MTFTRVVLADDHPALRLGIRVILERAPDISVVGEASDGVQTLHLVEDLAPDVLLLDMEMPGLTGVEVAQRLKAAGSPVRILALSSYDDKPYILGLLANGALGYLLKEEAPEKIVAAVRGVARGERHWVSQPVAAQMSTWDQEEKEPGGIDTNTIKS
jgi:DNA-binding NarL/FixJ family response regulator